jgi:hypothetical protein
MSIFVFFLFLCTRLSNLHMDFSFPVIVNFFYTIIIYIHTHISRVLFSCFLVLLLSFLFYLIYLYVVKCSSMEIELTLQIQKLTVIETEKSRRRLLGMQQLSSAVTRVENGKRPQRIKC